MARAKQRPPWKSRNNNNNNKAKLFPLFWQQVNDDNESFAALSVCQMSSLAAKWDDRPKKMRPLSRNGHQSEAAGLESIGNVTASCLLFTWYRISSFLPRFLCWILLLLQVEPIKSALEWTSLKWTICIFTSIGGVDYGALSSASICGWPWPVLRWWWRNPPHRTRSLPLCKWVLVIHTSSPIHLHISSTHFPAKSLQNTLQLRPSSLIETLCDKVSQLIESNAMELCFDCWRRWLNKW